MWSLYSAPLNSRKNLELPPFLQRNLANTRSPCAPTCHMTCSCLGNSSWVLVTRPFLVLCLSRFSPCPCLSQTLFMLVVLAVLVALVVLSTVFAALSLSLLPLVPLLPEPFTAPASIGTGPLESSSASK